MNAPIRIVVVGGGISGLAAAHRVTEVAMQRRVAVDLALCEARERLGGIIATERHDGYLIEAGPDAFLTDKPWGMALCDRLGLTPRLIGTRPTHRRTFVVHAGRLHPLPEGFALLAPTRLRPVLRSGLFSWRGKARMALDLVLPRGDADGDESLAHFVTRRLGREVLDRVAQPLVAGIYTADPATLSLGATMPRFLEMERRYGSVIRGLRHTRPSGNGPSGGAGGGPPWNLFVAPRDGMETLIASLASRLPAGAIHLGSRVLSVRPRSVPPGRPAYRLEIEGGSVMEADAVIIATEAHHAGAIVAGMDAGLAEMLLAIPYASSAVVTLAYRREKIAYPVDGFGFVVPHREGRSILACTFSSIKFSGRAPEGWILLRVFLGGSLQRSMLDRDDAGLAATAIHEVETLLCIAETPHLVRVHRHREAMPQYLVGHLDRIAAIEARTARYPGLALAGGAYRGVGIPDCIRSGEDAAERALAAGLHAQAAV
jgi:protoporphyrinogen/coproporphyrinogen III oxidase